MALSRLISATLVLGACLAGGGCSSFNAAWRQSAFSEPKEELQGRWQGVWKSQATGHTDKLRCLIAKMQDGTYSARFHAKYKKVLSFGYTVPLKAEREDGTWKFEGQADLGWLAGGVYRYEGSATGTNFFSTYTSKYDHGTFEMLKNQ
jgi:hypothetical protein